MNILLTMLEIQQKLGPANIHFLNRYVKLIEYRLSNLPTDHSEKHHIFPRCLCEYNDIVHLTIREHFLAHVLLSKAWPQSTQLHQAIAMMRKGRNKHFKSRDYKILKDAARKGRIGKATYFNVMTKQYKKISVTDPDIGIIWFKTFQRIVDGKRTWISDKDERWICSTPVDSMQKYLDTITNEMVVISTTTAIQFPDRFVHCKTGKPHNHSPKGIRMVWCKQTSTFIRIPIEEFNESIHESTILLRNLHSGECKTFPLSHLPIDGWVHANKNRVDVIDRRTGQVTKINTEDYDVDIHEYAIISRRKTKTSSAEF
jgi:hypothetical protein